MKYQGFPKLSTDAASDLVPSPTFTQQLHACSFSKAFQMKPFHLCWHGFVAVWWHGPRGIRLPTPNPSFAL